MLARKSTIQKQTKLGSPVLSMSAPTSIAVVHLVWAGSGIQQFENFIESYKRHQAGCEHALIIAFKGFEDDQSKLDAYLEFVREVAFETIVAPDVGKDIAAYRYVLSALASSFEKALFLNSSSEILFENWLLNFDRALAQDGTGVVGATGSWEQRDASDPWPNTHLRTNAFYACVEVLNQLDWGGADDSLRFEAGPASLYAQVKRMGLSVAVVGGNGESYSESEWCDAGTFRSFAQGNLMIADNRTRDYQVADEVKRAWFHIKAWQGFDPGPNPDKRGRVSYAWKNFIYRFTRASKKNAMIKEKL